MITTLYRREIEAAAGHEYLDADLVEALVLVESRGHRYAWNPEPRYRYFWNVRTKAPFRQVTDAENASEVPPSDFPCLIDDPDQEWWGQQASWGLMQVMGAVARERGLKDPYLPALCEVEKNLWAGCEHLHAMLLWARGDVMKALAAYNGGKGGWEKPRPQRYAAEVNAKLEEIQAARG